MTSNSRIDAANVKALLKEKMRRRMPVSGDYPSIIEGFSTHRREERARENCFYKPQILLVVQGEKRSLMGRYEYRFNEDNCLITGVDMPSASYLADASPENPFMCMSLALDKGLLIQLAAETPPLGGWEGVSSSGVLLLGLEPVILDAFLRLVELLDTPEQAPVLAPLLKREIHYRLLVGPNGDFLRSIHTLGSQSNQVSRAITWLKDNFREPLQVEALAARVNMATSTFHKHFKQVTSISPLQYQKRLRLYEAQRLMLAEAQNASGAALAVGYESPTQFNREYKRMFGEPPHRDVEARLR